MDLAVLSNLLVVNAGSSSLKLRLLDGEDRIVESADLPGGESGQRLLEKQLGAWPSFYAVGHRVVHGGSRFRTSVVVDDSVVSELNALSALAPLHNPAAVEGIKALRAAHPKIPAVACFDTAFHADLPSEAAVYGIPWEWTESLGVRRFGFHGLSFAYAARRGASLLERERSSLKLVICHLGAGASLAAVAGGRSVDTTMGFTPLEGLIMATRSGSVDPGALLWVQERLQLSPAQMAEQLDGASGLLGMSGVSGDMREILSAAERGGRRARLARDAYAHRVRTSIAAMAASMGGVDAIIFTGGVGEASAQVRRLACKGLEFLGLDLDQDLNTATAGDDVDLSRGGARTRVLRIRSREELEIAAEVRRTLAASRAG